MYYESITQIRYLTRHFWSFDPFFFYKFDRRNYLTLHLIEFLDKDFKDAGWSTNYPSGLPLEILNIFGNKQSKNPNI